MIKMITKKVATTFVIKNGIMTFLFFGLCSNITRRFTTKCSTYLQLRRPASELYYYFHAINIFAT